MNVWRDHTDVLTPATLAVAAEGLEKAFTLSELQTAIEDNLGAKMDKRNFRKAVRGMVCVIPGLFRRGSHRPARMYSVTSLKPRSRARGRRVTWWEQRSRFSAH